MEGEMERRKPMEVDTAFLLIPPWEILSAMLA